MARNKGGPEPPLQTVVIDGLAAWKTGVTAKDVEAMRGNGLAGACGLEDAPPCAAADPDPDPRCEATTITMMSTTTASAAQVQAVRLAGTGAGGGAG